MCVNACKLLDRLFCYMSPLKGAIRCWYSGEDHRGSQLLRVKVVSICSEISKKLYPFAVRLAQNFGLVYHPNSSQCFLVDEFQSKKIAGCRPRRGPMILQRGLCHVFFCARRLANEPWNSWTVPAMSVPDIWWRPGKWVFFCLIAVGMKHRMPDKP